MPLRWRGRSRRVLARRAEWPRLAAQARRFVETERTWTRSVGRYAERLPVAARARIRSPARRSRRTGAKTMCGIYGMLHLDGAPAAAEALRPMARRHRASRPGRRGRLRRRSAGVRHAAAVDHRRRRRPPAALQRGRHAVARRQRRDLQLPRAAQRAHRTGPPLHAPLRLRNDRFTCTSSTATPSSSV